MPTYEVIENKDDFEKNTTVTSDDADGQIPVDKGSADELDQEVEQAGSDDGNAAPSPSCDPLPDTEGDESSEATAESEPDSDSDADADSNDSHGDEESGTDASDTVEAAQTDGDTDDDDDDDDDDDGTAAGVEAESDSDTQPDDETADDSEQEPDAIVDGHDEAESCTDPSDEPDGDSDTDTVEEVESAEDDSPDGTDIGTDADTDTDTDDSEAIGDVVTDSDTHITVPIDLPNIDENSEKPVSLRDGIHPEDEDTDRKSRVPHAVKVAAGVIATVAVTAALVTSAVAVMVVEIHPNVIGGETIASQQAGGIDGSGKKISASYIVGDALHSSDDSDGPEILSWTDCWYTVAPGAKSVRAEIESAGKGSRIDLSDGTSIDVDGRYASRAGSFDAGIDIEGIAKLYGGDDGWVAIRYDASHVLVGKRVAGGESESE